MLRRALAVVASGLAAMLLVVLLDGAPPEAHAALELDTAPSSPGYVPEEAMGAPRPATDGDAAASLPALTGWGDRGTRRATDTWAGDDARARSERAQGEPYIHHVPQGQVGLLIPSVDGFPRLGPQERARVERVMRALAARLEELAHTPNDQGHTWAGMRGGKAGQAFAQSTVPGFGESYADAARRLIARALEDAAYALPPGKAEAFVAAATKAAAAGPPLEAVERILDPRARLRVRVRLAGLTRARGPVSR